MPVNGRRILYDSNYLYWLLYLILIAIRLSSSFHMHSSYLHPDEFFQSAELAAGDIYPKICNLKTWEFRNENPGPVRSPSAIWPFAHLPIFLYKQWLPRHMHNTTGTDWINRILFPIRLLTSAVSFIPDLFIIWLNSQSTKKRKSHRHASLLIYASMAYGGMVYGTRTLSNVWEQVMVCSFIFLSAQSGLGYLVCQAALSSWALFLRPSFVIFVFPFIILQIIRLFHQPCWRQTFMVYIPLGICVAASVAAFIIKSDTQYFKKPVGDWIIAPIRFAYYNSNSNTLKEHGLHPWYHYLIIHWPAILTPPIAIAAFIPPYFSKSLKFTCWTSLVLSTFAFSIVPHKETRFLLPAVPMAVVLGIDNLSTIFSKRKYKRILCCCLVLWMVNQSLLTIFWGFMHQGGLLPLLQSLPENSTSKHLRTLTIFHNTYMPPRFPFGIPIKDGKQQFFPIACFKVVWLESNCPSVIDLGGLSHSALMEILQCLKSQGSLRIRLIGPGSYTPSGEQLGDYGLLLSSEKYFPHISIEHLPSIKLPYCQLNMEIFNCLSFYWTDLKSQLSLHSYFILMP